MLDIKSKMLQQLNNEEIDEKKLPKPEIIDKNIILISIKIDKKIKDYLKSKGVKYCKECRQFLERKYEVLKMQEESLKNKQEIFKN